MSNLTSRLNRGLELIKVNIVAIKSSIKAECYNTGSALYTSHTLASD